MKNPFSLKWGKAQPAPAGPIYEEVPLQTSTTLRSYADNLLQSLRSNVSPSLGYDAESIKWLSDDVSAQRAAYSGEPKVKVANIYGAFLGTAIIEHYKALNGRWVENQEGMGVLLPEHSKIVFPITRVFKQIEDGDDYSMLSIFLAIPQLVDAAAPR
ncbi:hypothetical protein [Lysobacter sp. HA35]